MKTIKNIAIIAVSLTIASCANDNKKVAENNLDNYSTYVDSVTNLEANNALANWNEIELNYNTKKANLVASAEVIDNKEDINSKMEETSQKYEAYKNNIKSSGNTTKRLVASSLLGGNELDKDMKLTWINKDNILEVYRGFVNGVEENKDNYTREDWDEIKLIYEAIDSRKNTVENEGLTTSDNLKIAGLKVKFGPMYKINRIGAKSTENALAKKQ